MTRKRCTGHSSAKGQLRAVRAFQLGCAASESSGCLYLEVWKHGSRILDKLFGKLVAHLGFCRYFTVNKVVNLKKYSF